MAVKKCVRCGEKFDVSTVKRKINRRFGAGTYTDSFPDEDVCEECAFGEISCAVNTGKEIAEDMGSGWDDD